MKVWEDIRMIYWRKIILYWYQRVVQIIQGQVYGYRYKYCNQFIGLLKKLSRELKKGLYFNGIRDLYFLLFVEKLCVFGFLFRCWNEFFFKLYI